MYYKKIISNFSQESRILKSINSLNYFQNTMTTNLLILKKKILIFVIGFIGFTVFSQSKIKDITVTGDITPKKGAILELESLNKGFLTPRITTAQRDAIITANLTDGLLIFNTTTGCFNYYKTLTNNWLNICGTPPPASFSLRCDFINTAGDYKKGDALTTSNYLAVPITVSQAGTYVISATTTNGFYFEKEGSFPTAGNYTVNIPGYGTPNSGGINTPVAFSLNGINDSACDFSIPITNTIVIFSMKCNEATVNGVGKYLLGVDLTSENTLTVNVDVTTAGYWNINTNSVNGYFFNGNGTFANSGPQTVTLQGIGKPLASQTDTFTLTSNSDSSFSCTGVKVTVPPTTYTVDCNAATIAGSYIEDSSLVKTSNYITLPVDVTATGAYTIRTNTANGYSFSATGVFSKTGVQNINLNGEGKPITAQTDTFTITANGIDITTCKVQVPTTAAAVSYTIDCNSIKTLGTYRLTTPLIATNQITMNVNATYPGNYDIRTNSNNGMTFSGTGTLTKGSNTITLQGSGSPTTPNETTFSITTNSSSESASGCQAVVNITYRKINVLNLASGGYGLAFPNYTGREVLLSPTNFGPTSNYVKVDAINIVDGGSLTTAASLTKLIADNKIDIIVIAYNYNPNAEEIDILVNFIKNDKGVLLNFNETIGTATTGLTGLTNKLYGGTATSKYQSIGLGGGVYKLANISDDPVLNGPFSQSIGGLGGKYWGDDQGTVSYVYDVPDANIIKYSYAINAPVTDALSCFRDKTLGYLYASEGGFLGGNANDISANIFPSKMNSSYFPIGKTSYGSIALGGPQTVYNSVFFANAMAWAIQYVQTNKP